MRRIFGSLMALALAFGSGCSESDEAAGGASAKGAAIQARSLPAIWADILAQRDRVQAAVSKGTDMWHEDCAEVSSAATVLEALSLELIQGVADLPSVEDRRKSIQTLIGFLQTTIVTLRSDAIDETVGELPGVMIGFDALLQNFENHFTRDEIGSESVTSHPGFNPFYPAPPPSPI
jgi:hypothetical protein